MEIGIYGLGDMGKLYAKKFAAAGYGVNGCDLPEKRGQIEQELGGVDGINILEDGIAVARRSDFNIYCVEARNISDVVRAYGPSTRTGAIVAGATSVKEPEILAFESYLPLDVHINTFHSLHGPSLGPEGQTLALIRHRSSDDAYEKSHRILAELGSNIVEILETPQLHAYQHHDKITADTQAVTHLGFEAMGTAWKNAGFYPWENASYMGGIDNVKILTCLRIYAGKPHVYSGLAILNPFAREQIKQYAKSESELFKMMIQEDPGFRERIEKCGDCIFGKEDRQILLDDSIMGEYSLGILRDRKQNSHLSLLAMADAWHELRIDPYDNLICQTPPFRLRLGIVEYLFRNRDLLEESIEAALYDRAIRRDDLEFHTAVGEWASIIGNRDESGYETQFNDTKAFFIDRLQEGMRKSSELIGRLS